MYCNVHARALYIVTLSCRPQGSGSSYTIMCGCIWRYPSKFCQYIKSLYCYKHQILIICTLWFFLILMTETSIERPMLCWYADHSDICDKTAVQHFKKRFPKLLRRPLETLEAIYWCTRKLSWRKALAPECKFTILIFMLEFWNFLDIRCIYWSCILLILRKAVPSSTMRHHLEQ